MRKLKVIMEVIVAFLIAWVAYDNIYVPYQDQARAIARQQLLPAITQEKASELKEGELKIALLKVDHGDAILLQTKNKNILIDAGANKSKAMVETALTKNGVKQIDTIIVTHHHNDHMGNVISFAGKYKVRRIFDTGYVNKENPTSVKLNDILRKGNYNNRVLQSGDTVYLDKNYYLEILAPGKYQDKSSFENINNTSLVAKLHYGSFSMMLTGDTEAISEIAMAEKYGKQLKSDVLKVAHHGSKTSSNWNFVSQVKPMYALISCGSYEEYKHPNKAVVSRLQHLGAKVLNTYDNGQLTVITDGSSFRVENEK